MTPLERWEISQPGNVLRVFERGGGAKGEVGEPARDRRCRQARRQAQQPRIRHAAAHRSGFSRLAENAPARSAAFVAGHERSARAIIAPAAARPATWSMRTTARRNIPRNTRSSAISGFSASNDPTIPHDESGHPIRHEFTRSIPSSQCMVCHIHPGTNMVATYFGYTWWDNESDGDAMYPEAAAQSHRGRAIRGFAAQSRRRGRARAVVRREVSRGNGQRGVQCTN